MNNIITKLNPIIFSQLGVHASAVPNLRFITAACSSYDITSVRRLSAFLGQCFIESNNLQVLSENLNYSTAARIRTVWPSRFKTVEEAQEFVRSPQKLANRVYAGRNGNGDEASGDGWNYRGSGYIQLTGRANFALAARSTGRPYVEQPDLVRQPEDAARTAAWFWSRNGLNALADEWKIDDITRAVNGPARLHAKERRETSEKILKILEEL